MNIKYLKPTVFISLLAVATEFFFRTLNLYERSGFLREYEYGVENILLIILVITGFIIIRFYRKFKLNFFWFVYGAATLIFGLMNLYIGYALSNLFWF